jgi:hypothetical protein
MDVSPRTDAKDRWSLRRFLGFESKNSTIASHNYEVKKKDNNISSFIVYHWSRTTCITMLLLIALFHNRWWCVQAVHKRTPHWIFELDNATTRTLHMFVECQRPPNISTRRNVQMPFIDHQRRWSTAVTNVVHFLISLLTIVLIVVRDASCN